MASEFTEAADAAQDLIKEELLKGESQWISRVALSTMVMALLSALGALLAGVTSNELITERTKEILEVSQLEADRIHVELLKSKHEILTSLGTAVDNSEVEEIRKYQDEIEELKTEIEAEESKVQITIFEHELFAFGVTLLSIAITLSGISLVAKRKRIWAAGLVIGVIGAGLVGIGVYKMLS